MIAIINFLERHIELKTAKAQKEDLAHVPEF